MESRVLAENKTFRPSENVVTRTIADETILVPIAGNLANMEQIYTLNEVGASIWQLLDGKRSLADIRAKLLQEFNVEEEQLGSDLAEFIEQLQGSHLIVETSAR